MMIMLMQKQYAYLMLLLVLAALALTGCAADTLAEVAPSPTNTPAPALQSPSPAAAMLTWEGQTQSGNDGSLQCSQLELDAGGQARIGECESTGKAKQLFANRDQEWIQMQARFAPFEYRSATDHLVFHGTGVIAGAEWQRAILAWVHTTYAELSSGRVSAAVRTQMSWVVGPLPGQSDRCAHLVVLNFGYAFADTIPCQAGGQTQDSQGGWLEPAEMAQFDAWLYSRANYGQGATYFEGAGMQPVSEKDVQEMNAWARSVYARLKPSGPLPTEAETSPGHPQEVKIDHVEVQVGQGSPIPVSVVVDGNFPDICSQIAEIRQQLDGDQFKIAVMTSSQGGERCIQDELPFRLAIPLNVVPLEPATYKVIVNGASASFQMPLHPQAP